MGKSLISPGGPGVQEPGDGDVEATSAFQQLKVKVTVAVGPGGGAVWGEKRQEM